jgi:hypothetical protein
MADNVELIMRFHPVGGEDVSVVSTDFPTETLALEAIARALDGRRSLVLAHARYNRATYAISTNCSPHQPYQVPRQPWQTGRDRRVVRR